MILPPLLTWAINCPLESKSIDLTSTTSSSTVKNTSSGPGPNSTWGIWNVGAVISTIVLPLVSIRSPVRGSISQNPPFAVIANKPCWPGIDPSPGLNAIVRTPAGSALPTKSRIGPTGVKAPVVPSIVPSVCVPPVLTHSSSSNPTPPMPFSFSARFRPFMSLVKPDRSVGIVSVPVTTVDRPGSAKLTATSQPSPAAALRSTMSRLLSRSKSPAEAMTGSPPAISCPFPVVAPTTSVSTLVN